MARTKKEAQALPKPPWVMTEEEKAQAYAEREAQAKAQEEAQEEATPEAEAPSAPKTNYAFGRLHEMDCPFDERVSVEFHVGTLWGVLNAPVKDDDGKGLLRRTRLMAPYWHGLDQIIHPLTEEPLANPDPADLDSYRVVTEVLANLWGTPFTTWFFREGLEKAIEEAAGITEGN